MKPSHGGFIPPFILQWSIKMPIVTQFRSSFPSGGYALKDGTSAIFMNHIHRTTNPEYIAELKEAIAAGHPQITGGEEIDTEQESPLAGLKAKIKAEFLAELAAQQVAAIDVTNDMGGTKDINSAFGALTSDTNTTATTSSTLPSGVAGGKVIPVAKVTGGK